MYVNILKSILHNCAVAAVSLCVGIIGIGFDWVFKIQNIRSGLSLIIGLVLLSIGFSIRVWATYLFYKNRIKVIVLEPQRVLITTGPYAFSRNPLYLGGNVFMFFGAAFIFGSISGLAVTLLGIFASDFMIRREEGQLQNRFGEKWTEYTKRVRRWI